MEIIFNSEYSPMWAAFGTIASSIASILAIAALIYSMTSFKKSLQTSHYSELDSMYFELLKTVLANPHLRDSSAKRSAEQSIEYDVYAFMVWNFLEAIFDRCQKDEDLCRTWYPVMDSENRNHRGWFDHEDNHHKFKESFRAFIKSGKFEQA